MLQHNPVLLEEVLYYLDAKKSGNFIDATFGAGGYSRAILDSNSDNSLLALDRDDNVKNIADKFITEYRNRFSFCRSRFSRLKSCVAQSDIEQVNGIVFDLGVSSMQLDNDFRGFSFAKEARLDMRMGDNDISAYEVVNNFKEEEIADIIFEYGEERYARRIAKNIILKRNVAPISTTTELSQIITEVKPVDYKAKIHPATKSFQAIRIFVNRELEELSNALEQAREILHQGGKLVVVSFHGLEDKIVKNFIKKYSGMEQNNNRYAPANHNQKRIFKNLTRKVVKAKLSEVENNPRSRSAILRAVEKL